VAATIRTALTNLAAVWWDKTFKALLNTLPGWQQCEQGDSPTLPMGCFHHCFNTMLSIPYRIFKGAGEQNCVCLLGSFKLPGIC
jgi:hypothetical protein